MTKTATSSAALMRSMALALALAALLASQPQAAQACGTRVDLAAIEAAMADPGLDPALLRQARDLKGKAATAIEDGHAAEGNGHYRALMSLLQLNKPSSLKRC